MSDAPAPCDGLLITRVFDAPRERVWREWTTPEAFADWYGGPECEVPVESVSMDLRPGGGWKATMSAGPDRREIHWEREYVEVVEPERLAFTVTRRRSHASSGESPGKRARIAATSGPRCGAPSSPAKLPVTAPRPRRRGPRSWRRHPSVGLKIPGTSEKRFRFYAQNAPRTSRASA